MPTAAYLGTTARLLPLEWVTSLQVDQPSRYVVQSAPTRAWAFAPGGANRIPRRTWDVSLTAGSETMANLEAFASGVYGSEPLRFIPEAAHLSNVLTPAQSLLTASSGPPTQMAGGHAPRTSIGPDAQLIASGVPVLPGQPLTVSIDASGDTTMLVIFRNASGDQVDSVGTESVGVLMQRITMTSPVVPPNARSIDIMVLGHLVAGRPQVTWTRRPRLWAPGAGATNVIIDSLMASQMHLDHRFGVMQGVSLRIQEVG